MVNEQREQQGVGPPPETLGNQESSYVPANLIFWECWSGLQPPRRLSSWWRTFPEWNHLIRCSGHLETQTSPTASRLGHSGFCETFFSPFFYSKITAAPKTWLKVPSVFDFYRRVHILISSAAKNVFFLYQKML